MCVYIYIYIYIYYRFICNIIFCSKLCIYIYITVLCAIFYVQNYVYIYITVLYAIIFSVQNLQNPSEHTYIKAWLMQLILRSYDQVEEGGYVLFNDAFNTFYSWLYGVRHMVKDHSDSERGNLLPPHGLLSLIRSKGSFICINPQTG